jgi:long-chain acyl-CoA synthetase
MGLSSALMRAAQIAPKRIALRFGDQSYTWAEFGDRAPRIAGGLAALGVQKGDRVAMLGLNNARYSELFHCVPWTGGVVVPLNWRWSEVELAFALDDCEPRVLFVDEQLMPMGRKLCETRPNVRLISMTDFRDPDLPHFDDLLDATPIADFALTGDDLYGIFYTGGTTGFSKGVMLSHRNVLSGATVAQREGYWREDDTYLVAAPYYHASGTWPLISMLAAAGTSIVLPAFDATAALRAIEEYKATTSLLVPTMIQMVIDHPNFSKTDLSSLKTVVYGASPITEALLTRALAALPNAEFVQAYGMTELSPQIAALHHRHLIGPGREAGRHRAAGRACYGMEIKVVDEDDKEQPRGEVGEIIARGESVMLGYWRRPEETEKALRNGWMHTGDGGRMDENGFVYVVDRIKDMIISGGENVYSVEVENVITQHPAVHGCVVVGIPHEKWVEQVHAIVILRDGANATEAELIEFARTQLAGFKVPRSVVFRTEPFPLTPANKILKRALREPYWAGRSSRLA